LKAKAPSLKAGGFPLLQVDVNIRAHMWEKAIGAFLVLPFKNADFECAHVENRLR